MLYYWLYTAGTLLIYNLWVEKNEKKKQMIIEEPGIFFVCYNLKVSRELKNIANLNVRMARKLEKKLLFR